MLILAFGLWRANKVISHVALSIFLLATVTVVPAFLLGEGAEELVEDIKGVNEDNIESHEEVAELALWMTVALGALSAFGLMADKKGWGTARFALTGALGLSLLSSSLLAYAAQEGGKIRHPEAFAAIVGETAGKGHDDD
jgi:hypothetical protein